MREGEEMSDGIAKTRIAVASALCAAVMAYASGGFLADKTSAQSYTLPASHISCVTEIVNEGGEKEIIWEKAEEKAETNDSNLQSEAISASASGAVLGKINEKFISPYTANTSYKNIYLKNSTDLKIDIKSLVNEPLKYKVEKGSSPSVLIIHTHATESFLNESRDYYTDSDLSRTTDKNMNVTALGRIVADKLKNAGYGVIHDETLHDYPSYSESYSRAAKTINGYIKKYPGIKIVIDIHRDSISAGNADKVKVTSKINGKKAAQIMIVMGSQSGSVKNFPNWKENLKLALRLQQKTESMYPSLARSISLMPRNYNESLTTGSMLIEMGTEANSIEEVKYSAELLGSSLCALLDEI